MIQDVGDSLSAEPLLAEVLCQNGCGHFLQISHRIDRNSIADHLFQIRRRDIFRLPHFLSSPFLFILLVHRRDNLPGTLQKSHEFLESLAFLRLRIIPAGLEISQILKQFFLIIQEKSSAVNLRCVSFILRRFQCFVSFFVFLCFSVQQMMTVAIPVNHFLRVVEIKILLAQHSGEKI